MTVSSSQTAYDESPYPNLTHELTHPDRLATLATLLGMSPVPVENCRVLELGCAGGANVLSMAYGLPNSHFVGIDLSEGHIEEAMKAAQFMGVTNATFQTMDIMDVKPELGQFDYIIAHGIYSWVPVPVREQVMRICKQNLSPQGVAYVSYNTYPGWHILRMIREMMQYRTRHIEDPHERATEAFTFMRFMADSTSAKEYGGSYKGLFEQYIAKRPAQLTDYRGDAAILHDELNEVNDPFYFHQFVEHAAQHDLQYLIEANFTSSFSDKLPSDASSFINQIANDAVEVEQYIDFVSNRTFRRTLLCHKEVQLTRQINPDLVGSLYVASLAKVLEVSDENEKTENPDVERFRASDDATFATDHPLTKAAMHHLIDICPKVISFKTLLKAACDRLGIENVDETDAMVLKAGLLQAFTYSALLAELRIHAPQFCPEISESPVANPLARYQSRYTGTVTNLRHEALKLPGLGRFILPFLDGDHTVDQILDMLVELVEQGAIKPPKPMSSDPVEMREELAGEVQEILQGLAYVGVMVE
jgi:methyltransferase-like protein/SAM-dependent methyltransferase